MYVVNRIRAEYFLEKGMFSVIFTCTPFTGYAYA